MFVTAITQMENGSALCDLQYAYCGNNPVVYYDPSGYEGENCHGSRDSVDPKKVKGGMVENGTEDFYRTMSDKEYKKLQDNKKLTKREKGASELKVTRESDYVTDDLSKRKNQGKKYNNTVKFDMSEGTEKNCKI